MSVLPPPNTGIWSYNGYVPVRSYVDPVFGTVVRRITGDHGRDDLYGRNMWWNADGGRYLHRTFDVPGKADAWDVIDVLTGIVTHSGIPFGTVAADGGFDPVDPDRLWRLNGNEVQGIRLSGGRWEVVEVFAFPSPVKELGGSVNWHDRGGRFMVVRWGDEPSVRVYDRRDWAAGPYANAIDATHTVEQGSYLGLSPNGRYVVGFDSRRQGSLYVGGVSWRLDHASRTVDPEPTVFWSQCGDHGAFVSASDDRDYMVTYDCNSQAGLWRVDITNHAEGLTEAQQQALPGNKLLLPFDSWRDFGHVASVARGARKDWVYVSTEDTTDKLNGGVSPWHAYRQEILAVHVLSGQVHRFAHHRSRSLGDDYYAQPRISCAWDGSVVGWASNYNRAGVVDVYGVVL